MIDINTEFENLKTTGFYPSLGIPERIYTRYKLYGDLMLHDLFDHWLHDFKDKYLFFPVTEQGEYLANTNGAARSYVYAELTNTEPYYDGLYAEVDRRTDTFIKCVEYWRSQPQLVYEYYNRINK